MDNIGIYILVGLLIVTQGLIVKWMMTMPKPKTDKSKNKRGKRKDK